MNEKIILRASKVKRRNKIKKIVKLALLILVLLLLILYLTVSIVYNNGNFTVSLDKNLYLQRGLIIYDDPNYKVYRTELYAKSLDYFDNISYKWLPTDLNDYDGAHNGNNYMAYTFYIENTGDKASDYWSEIIIDDVIKKVDEAVRIRVYKNGDYTTYAKMSDNGQPEPNSVSFVTDTMIATEHVENFNPGDINKYTVVLWLEGSDPECTENILGGVFKFHMEFKSEFVEK